MGRTKTGQLRLRGAQRGTWVAIGVVVLACGGPRTRVMSVVETGKVEQSLAAYERFREEEGPDPRLLGYVAALLLETEAKGTDPSRRDAALNQLAVAGTRGEDVLEGMLELPATSWARAQAARVLARRGHGDAREVLRGLLHTTDPELFACGVTSLDAGTEWPTLLAAATHAAAAVRVAAFEALTGAAPRPAVATALGDAARMDPVPQARVAALRALGHQGELGFDAARERLSDASPQVRLAAVAALVAAHPERARAVLGPLLAQPPEPASVEAARQLALATRDDDHALGATDARAYLLAALRAGDGSVRAQAAVAVASLGEEPGLDRGLAAALAAETDDGVRISLAGVLMRRSDHADAARRVLQQVVATVPARMPSIQAAAILAQHGDRSAVQRLVEWLRHPEHAERRVAARALARDALEPDAARVALRDADALVRIAAAGGILAAIPALDA